MIALILLALSLPVQAIISADCFEASKTYGNAYGTQNSDLFQLSLQMSDLTQVNKVALYGRGNIW